VRAALPQARLFVVGAAERSFDDLERLLSLEGVDGRLHWLSDDEVNLWAAAADVCVLPYDHGAHSGVLHRAVANATPVLASPPLADEVGRFCAGEIVELRPEAWSSALTAALGSAALPAPMTGGLRTLGPATKDVYRFVLELRGRGTA
jgi:hypothetical protein